MDVDDLAIAYGITKDEHRQRIENLLLNDAIKRTRAVNGRVDDGSQVVLRLARFLNEEIVFYNIFFLESQLHQKKFSEIDPKLYAWGNFQFLFFAMGY